MQPVKHREQLVGVAHVEAHAIVRDVVNRLLACTLARDDNLRLHPAPSILEGIAEEVHPHLAQQRTISQRRRQLPGLQLRHPGRFARTNLRPHLAHERVHVEQPGAHGRAAQPRKCQKIVDECRHVLGLPAHHAEQPPPLRVERRTAFLLQHPGKPIHGAQRRPQIVGDRVRKRLQLLIRRLQLRRPGPHEPVHLGRIPARLREQERVFHRERDLPGGRLQQLQAARRRASRIVAEDAQPAQALFSGHQRECGEKLQRTPGGLQLCTGGDLCTPFENQRPDLLHALRAKRLAETRPGA